MATVQHCASCDAPIVTRNGNIIELTGEYDNGARYKRGIHTAERCHARAEWHRKYATNRQTQCAVCGETFDGDTVRWHGTAETGLCEGYEQVSA